MVSISGGILLTFAYSVKNLGVILFLALLLEKQVNAVAKKPNFLSAQPSRKDSLWPPGTMFLPNESIFPSLIP